MNATKTKKKTIKIQIDQQSYEVDTKEMSGAQLKELAGIPSANLLFRDVKGPGDDEQIADSTVVHLHNHEEFYDMPPGNFGRN
jgi:hypothetical protein